MPKCNLEEWTVFILRMVLLAVLVGTILVLWLTPAKSQQMQTVTHHAPSGRIVSVEQRPCPERCIKLVQGMGERDTSGAIKAILVWHEVCDCDSSDVLKYGCPICGNERVSCDEIVLNVWRNGDGSVGYQTGSRPACDKCGISYGWNRVRDVRKVKCGDARIYTGSNDPPPEKRLLRLLELQQKQIDLILGQLRNIERGMK